MSSKEDGCVTQGKASQRAWMAWVISRLHFVSKLHAHDKSIEKEDKASQTLEANQEGAQKGLKRKQEEE